MEPTTGVAQTHHMTLDEVLARLAESDLVDGILLLGSTATGALRSTSDDDLLRVLQALPAPLRLVTTTVDRWPTEVSCMTVRAIERIIATPAAWPASSEEQVVVGWLREGELPITARGVSRPPKSCPSRLHQRLCPMHTMSTRSGGRSATTWHT